MRRPRISLAVVVLLLSAVPLFVVAVQADGNTMWSAPMWITWN